MLNYDKTYIRSKCIPIGKILPHIANRCDAKLEVFGKSVNVKSLRLQTFQKSNVCVGCGAVGTHFTVDTHRYSKTVNYHLNMYGFDREGNEVLFTKDHIIPKSRGGKERISNMQTMCVKCNQKKGNNL